MFLIHIGLVVEERVRHYTTHVYTVCRNVCTSEKQRSKDSERLWAGGVERCSRGVLLRLDRLGSLCQTLHLRQFLHFKDPF